jgi:hypothetical protein
MKTYTVTINEYQRNLVLQALRHLALTQADLLKSQPADPSGIEDSAYEDTTMAISLLDDLPNLEHMDPGIIHGLCF